MNKYSNARDSSAILIMKPIYENDFGVSCAFGAGNTKIVFLKACYRGLVSRTEKLLEAALSDVSKNFSGF
jgi:hypothetical protein